MEVPLAVLDEEPLVVAGSGYETVRDLELAEELASLSSRVLDPDDPVGAVDALPEGADRPAEVDERVLHPTALHEAVGFSDRVALGDSAEVELHAFVREHNGLVVLVKENIAVVYQGPVSYTHLRAHETRH